MSTDWPVKKPAKNSLTSAEPKDEREMLDQLDIAMLQAEERRSQAKDMRGYLEGLRAQYEEEIIEINKNIGR